MIIELAMDTDSLKKIIENKVKYKYLYEVFDKYHEIPLETVDWHDWMIKEVTEEYKILMWFMIKEKRKEMIEKYNEDLASIVKNCKWTK